MNYKLILVRHGQSTYNLENKFTGWKDVVLTEKGVNEAIECSSLLSNITIDICYSSVLKRATKTLDIILNNINQSPKIITHQSLNERDYGNLIGKNKTETAKIYGNKQVELWRRSYKTAPPGGESLEMTCNRVIPYFKNIILKSIHDNYYKNILISAHGNSIRAIILHLLNYTPNQIIKTEVGWCKPWILHYDNNKLLNIEILKRPNEKSRSFLPFKPKLNINNA